MIILDFSKTLSYTFCVIDMTEIYWRFLLPEQRLSKQINCVIVKFDYTHRCDVDYIEAYLKSRLMAFCQFIRNTALYLF